MAQVMFTPQVLLGLIDAVKVLLLAFMLLWHVQHRRYPQERKATNLWGFLGFHVVELGFIAAMVPSIISIAKLLT